MTEWDKLCKEMKRALEASNIPLSLFSFRRVKAEGDKLQEDYEASQGALGKIFLKLADEQEKLETIRGIVKIPDVWSHPDPIKEIRELLESSIDSDSKRNQEDLEIVKEFDVALQDGLESEESDSFRSNDNPEESVIDEK